jgi:phosphoribosylformylglycinamidine synthase PurS subunit
VRARVLVKPKAGILDPQGQAVERALPALGFTGVRNVHVGRLIELDVEDPRRLPEMCERLLTNPLIEDYEIVESPGGDSTGSLPGAVESAGADSIGTLPRGQTPGVTADGRVGA